MTDGPVLELGMGQYSTRFLNMMCRLQDRQLVSYDNDEKGHRENKRYIHPKHEVHLTDCWEEIDIDNTHWSVVLIDHRPAHRRWREARRLKDKADYILLHDSDPERERVYGYFLLNGMFKHSYNYDKLKPNTLVVSNFKDLSKL